MRSREERIHSHRQRASCQKTVCNEMFSLIYRRPRRTPGIARGCGWLSRESVDMPRRFCIRLRSLKSGRHVPHSVKYQSTWDSRTSELDGPEKVDVSLTHQRTVPGEKQLLNWVHRQLSWAVFCSLLYLIIYLYTSCCLLWECWWVLTSRFSLFIRKATHSLASSAPDLAL